MCLPPRRLVFKRRVAEPVHPSCLVRCAILCLERALESGMDSIKGQHGNSGTGNSQAGVLSVLLSILASKRVVLDRQHGRNRLDVGLGSLTDSAK
jgi:hypothetical protein